MGDLVIDFKSVTVLLESSMASLMAVIITITINGTAAKTGDGTPKISNAPKIIKYKKIDISNIMHKLIPNVFREKLKGVYFVVLILLRG